jgi:hypothetical protein
LPASFLNSLAQLHSRGLFVILQYLYNCDWLRVLNENSVDSAVYNFTARVSVKPKSSTFPHWFYKSLIYYIKRKNQFFKKYKSDYYYNIFSYYHKVVKTTIKTDRLVWLKTIDNNLRTQQKHFWKCISKFKRDDQSVTEIEIGNKIITEPQFIAEAFADHFSFIFNSSSFVNTLNSSDCNSSDSLNIPYISDSDIKRAIIRLRLTKCIRSDEIPNLIIKGWF